MVAAIRMEALWGQGLCLPTCLRNPEHILAIATSKKYMFVIIFGIRVRNRAPPFLKVRRAERAWLEFKEQLWG